MSKLQMRMKVYNSFSTTICFITGHLTRILRLLLRVLESITQLINLNDYTSQNFLDTLFVILNLWKVVNKGEELEGEDWSKNKKN